MTGGVPSQRASKAKNVCIGLNLLSCWQCTENVTAQHRLKLMVVIHDILNCGRIYYLLSLLLFGRKFYKCFGHKYVLMFVNMTRWDNTQIRADSRITPSQWETVLLSNDASRRLGASILSSLKCIQTANKKRRKRWSWSSSTSEQWVIILWGICLFLVSGCLFRKGFNFSQIFCPKTLNLWSQIRFSMPPIGKWWWLWF